MPGGTPIRLGPFTGGLNSASDPSAVADTELVEFINMELDIDGSLISRPPIVEVSSQGAWTARGLVLGSCVFSSGTYVIVSNTNGVFAYNGTSWSTITTTFQASSMVQYKDFIWLVAVPGAANPGGKWDGTTFTAVAAIPKGGACIVHKERMFVLPGLDATTNTSRITFSNAGDFNTWTGSDFIDVNPGDGEKLIDAVVYQDNLLLFKQDSTYVLAYDIKPSDAIVRKISNTLGATKQRCTAVYENSVFLYHEGDVYEIINYDFHRINTKVPFFYDATAPATRTDDVFLSVFGDRLLVRYFNRIYVYGLRTRTWSRWESSSSKLHNFGPLVPFPVSGTIDVNVKYYMGSGISNDTSFMYFLDGYESTIKEKTLTVEFLIDCLAKTKNYDMADSGRFKRLYWWGADVLTARDVTGTVTPVVVGFSTTWQDLYEIGWEDITSSWDAPLTSSLSIATIVNVSGAVLRRFVKFLKAVRFRQVNFMVEISTDGSSVDGPVRIFTMTSIIKIKQVVTAAVS